MGQDYVKPLERIGIFLLVESRSWLIIGGGEILEGQVVW